MRRRPNLIAWLVLTFPLLAAVGCQRAPSPETQAQLSQLDSVTAQRDSLFSEVAQNARLMNELGEELGKVEGLQQADSSAVESPISESHENLVSKVRQITTRLADSEKRLAESRRQLRRMTGQADSLKQRVAQLESQVGDFEAMIEGQKTTVASLTERLEAVEATNIALRDTIGTMADTISTLATQANTAYYVVGTEKELVDRGLLVKEGGARVLFIFGKAGQTLAPARELDPSQFTPIDLRTMTEIPLPDSTAKYKIASRQNLAYLATPIDGRNTIQGSLRISEPQEFWHSSKFLIVVRS